MALTITVLIRRIASNLTTTQFRIAALHRAGGYGSRRLWRPAAYLQCRGEDGGLVMTSKLERAVLAGGCFWGMQDLIRKLPGVVSTRVGYTTRGHRPLKA